MLFDFTDLPAGERYKLLTATIVPRPIGWTVTRSTTGLVNVAPFSFFNAFAPDPPLVALGLGPRSTGGAKDTAENIEATGQFVVHLVSEHLAARMNVTAAELAPEIDEAALAGLATLPSTKVTPPRLVAAAVAMECILFQTIPLRSGWRMVLGEVVAMHVRDDAVLDAARHHIDTPALRLIGRMHGRGFYARTTDLFDLRRPSAAEALAGTWPEVTG